MSHIERNMPAEAHTPMYNWHKFWARKTWNVVGQFVENYCPEGGIVLDPFSGSGVTAIESLRSGRKAIAIDLLPIANHILAATITPVDLKEFQEAYSRVEKRAKNNILALYDTGCRKCGEKIVLSCMIWKKGKPNRIRYRCIHCGDRQDKGYKLTPADECRLKEIESIKIKTSYPQQPLYYSDGKAFMKKEKYESLDQLFTHRNLVALTILRDAIESETDRKLKFLLKVAFTSMVHLCTRMMPVRPSRPFSGFWAEPSYWYAPANMEQNVWREFESAMVGRQGLLVAKQESNQEVTNVQFAKNLDQIFSGAANILILTGSSLDIMNNIPERSIDYIFTDPPYDSSIQYGELCFLWEAWFGDADTYVENLRDEVIHNERQNKDFDAYYRMLASSFREMFRILKDDSYLTVTFHNPTTKVRNATIRAGTFAGFNFEKIHWQQLARPSAKSLLQPFGSANGDFYLRFHKLQSGKEVATPQEIDETRFERIVVESTKQLLAERGEPTPYTIIINYIDPILAKNGFFLALHTGLDVKTVLKNHIDQEFTLVSGKIGGAEGELWWFKDTAIIPHFEIPLSERVEQTVIRKLTSEHKVSFTQLWEAISVEFPNALTSDSSSLMDILEEYGTKTSEGLWSLKPIVTDRQTQHAEMIGILAEIGCALGFKTWVGLPEQSKETKGFAEDKSLARFCIPRKLELKGLSDEQLDEILNIDLLWYKDGKIEVIFEVENTTVMTEALRRASCIPYKTIKYMVLPDERMAQLAKKLKSPMFAQWYEGGNWNVIYYDSLRANARKLAQGKVQLSNISGIFTKAISLTKKKRAKQLELL